MAPIFGTRGRDKCTLLIFVLFLIFVLIHLYLNHWQESYQTAQRAGDRCLSELASVKYQLTVVTEYKNRIDKLLSEAQKSHESDMERFKEIMDGCAAMKQQTVICQNQFEDLQSECKKAREELTQVTKELEKYKTGGKIMCKDEKINGYSGGPLTFLDIV